jgi:hypothetical protein
MRLATRSSQSMVWRDQQSRANNRTKADKRFLPTGTPYTYNPGDMAWATAHASFRCCGRSCSFLKQCDCFRDDHDPFVPAASSLRALTLHSGSGLLLQWHTPAEKCLSVSEVAPSASRLMFCAVSMLWVSLMIYWYAISSFKLSLLTSGSVVVFQWCRFACRKAPTC